MTDDKKTFDLTAFIAGRSRAKDSETLYTDEDAANEASRHLEYNQDGQPIGVLKGHEDEYQAATARLEDSAITVHLEGAHEGKVDALRKEYGIKGGGADDNDVYEKWLVDVLVEQYVKTETADGAVDETPRTSEDWFSIKSMLPRTQWGKLLAKVGHLIYVSATIDENTDAGFLANS